MAGIDNLIPNSMRSKEEVRAHSSKGGIASGKARRRKKMLREYLEACLSVKTGKKNFNGKKIMTYGEEAMESLTLQAASGDLKAMELVGKWLGEFNEKIDLNAIVEQNTTVMGFDPIAAVKELYDGNE